MLEDHPCGIDRLRPEAFVGGQLEVREDIAV